MLLISRDFLSQVPYHIKFTNTFDCDVACVSDSVNQGINIAKRMHASLYNWIVYKQKSKAKERKEEEGQCRKGFYIVR